MGFRAPARRGIGEMARPTDEAIARECDGATLVFRAYDHLWMIDRLARPAANDDDDAYEGEVVDLDEDGDPVDAAIEGSTAVCADEIAGMDERDREAFIARQLRKLGLPADGDGAAMLGAMLDDFERFEP